MTGLSALILGATGAAGRSLLQELLASPEFSQVAEYGRRVTPLDRITSGREKLVQKVIDFERLETAGLADENWDVVCITLGVTRRAAGSEEAFEKIDRGYVLAAAKAAKSKDPKHIQRLLYLSGVFADISSRSLYNRSKALTEIGLAQFHYHETIVFRAGFLGNAERDKPKPMDGILNFVGHAISGLNHTLWIPLQSVTKLMRIAAERGSAGLPQQNVHAAGPAEAPFVVLSNSDMMAALPIIVD